MDRAKTATKPVQLDVENIGGITDTTVEFTPGITVLAGRNATNRTSLLQAIMAALGSDSATIKGDASEGRIELTIGDKTYTRRFTRRNGTVATDGEPYLEDATLANLFAFLLESNEARQAVARGDDLRTVIMKPVDTSEIKGQIEQFRSQRERIDEEIDKIRSLKQSLPELEGEKSDLQDSISAKRGDISEVEEQIASIDQDIGKKRGEKEKLEEKLGELNDIRSELEAVRHQLDTQHGSLMALREEREDLEADCEDYEEIPDGRLEGIEAEIQRLQTQKNGLDSTVNELQTVIEFNEGLLDGSFDIFDDLQESDGEITDQLLGDDDALTCWTCGSQTDTSQIESMVSDLRDLRDRYMDQRGDLDVQIDDLADERRQLQEKQRQRAQIEDRLEAITDEIEQRETRIADLKGRRSGLTDHVEDLEAEVEDLQTDKDQDSEIIELHKEANQLEVEIDRLESNLERVEGEIAEIEDRAAEQESLEAQREELEGEIENLRTRVERLEQDAVTQFNNHMESVLDLLGYENLERIWIERTEEEVRQGRQTVTEGRFDLHVVRSTETGSVYEDTVETLSESEREVTGLVFALAGYLVHDVHEEVPFMLLDSIEAIDAPRIANLVEYFEEHVDHLVVALLEEDAQALDDTYQRVADI